MTPVGTRHAVAWTLTLVTSHTGIAASWCPVCGACTCPWALDWRGLPCKPDRGSDPRCPLHGLDSTHEEGPVEP